MPHIIEVESGNKVEVEIVLAGKVDVPLKKDGWNFAWRDVLKGNGQTYVLRILGKEAPVEGVLNLKDMDGMKVMNLLEIAPWNVGSKSKRYDGVAGCLIAFGCRESFKMDGNYLGFLIFTAKTNLIPWYISKYGAVQAAGHKMFIEPAIGIRLVNQYLEQ